MKLITALFMLISLNSYAVDKIIYGNDNRLEISKFHAAHLGEGVAVMIHKKNLKKIRKENHFILSKKVENLKSSHGLCKKNRFLDQPTAGACTGFLVSPKILLTAGHCFRLLTRSSCRSFHWVFDYKMEEGKDPMNMVIPVENV